MESTAGTRAVHPPYRADANGFDSPVRRRELGGVVAPLVGIRGSADGGEAVVRVRKSGWNSGRSGCDSAEVADEPLGHEVDDVVGHRRDGGLGNRNHRLAEQDVDAGDGDRADDECLREAVEGEDRRDGKRERQREVLGR